MKVIESEIRSKEVFFIAFEYVLNSAKKLFKNYLKNNQCKI